MGTVEVMRKFVGLPASPELHKECFKQYAPEMDSEKVHSTKLHKIISSCFLVIYALTLNEYSLEVFIEPGRIHFVHP